MIKAYLLVCGAIAAILATSGCGSGCSTLQPIPGGFPAALKFVSLAGEGVHVERRSLEILKAIRHPNLLTTFGAWQVPGALVIAMELADILFVIICLANSQKIDLDEAFKAMMAKVTARDAGRWTRKAR